MNLHEYQAKQLFREHGIPVPAGAPATTNAEVTAAAAALGGDAWVLKAQIHAGGRGKAGGIHLCTHPDQLLTHATELLGQRLSTAQTASHGLPVNCLLIETPSRIARELYLSMLIDRTSHQVAIIAAPSGGMDIEELAARQPELISKVRIHPAVGLQAWQGLYLSSRLGLSGTLHKQLVSLLAALYQLFIKIDATLIEINPLAVTTEDTLIAVDAKVQIDDNALTRQSELTVWRDLKQEDAREASAQHHGLNYIALNGTIGCMVNGAGLAMATMDLIQYHGGTPANFLDVGGTATSDRVKEAFQLILSDPNVAAVLVNIFGGIVRCDIIADGLIQAMRQQPPSVPLVVRLAGTNAEQGLARLAASGLPLQTARDLTTAAQQVIMAAHDPHRSE
jgi:succinyl-CoA synthetase beta subunit